MTTFKIALLGDSMADHWGSDCSELQEALGHQFKQSEFIIENHGLANTRIGYGLWRLCNDYEKNGLKRASVLYSNPDIIVIESFAYSNSVDGTEGLSEYRDILGRFVEEINQATAAKVLFYITVPPHRERFLENVPNYYHTSLSLRQRQADAVKLYIDEARRVIQESNWPLADVPAEVERRLESGENPRRFINQSDNLHPSQYGYFIMARMLVRALDNYRMIEEASEH